MFHHGGLRMSVYLNFLVRNTSSSLFSGSMVPVEKDYYFLAGVGGTVVSFSSAP